jgi:hypothetical protein
MITLLQTDPTAEWFACPSCRREILIPLVHKVIHESMLPQLFEGGVNQAECQQCRQPVVADIPLLVNIPDSCIPPIQYIPFKSLEKPEVIESLIHRDPSIRVVYSTGELMRSIEAEVRFGLYREHGICPSEESEFIVNQLLKS